MPTPVSECLYCSKLPILDELMIKITDLKVSELYLFKEQSHPGRCNVVYKDHGIELYELSEEDRNAFMNDIVQAARAIQKVFQPAKINYGAFSDKLSHLHFHLVPKYSDGYNYGGVIEMNPQKVYLKEEEYDQMIQRIKSSL